MDTLIENIGLVTILVTSITALIITIIKSVGQTKNAIQENIPQNIKSQSTTNLKINTELEKLKELLNADRIHIYDFHNGGHYANGRSALKMSCTYETVRYGIESIQMLMQNIPLSVVSRFVSHLLDNGDMEVKDIAEIEKCMPATYQLKKDFKIMAYYDIIINNDAGEPIGLLSIQYVKNAYHINKEKDKILIYKTKIYIEQLLSNL